MDLQRNVIVSFFVMRNHVKAATHMSIIDFMLFYSMSILMRTMNFSYNDWCTHSA